MTTQDIEQLFRTHYTAMYRLALTILYDEDESKDAVSEVFVHLLEKEYKEAPPLSYLLAAVRNQCLNMIEHHQVHERIIRLLSEEACLPTPTDIEHRLMDELLDYNRRHLTPLTRQIFKMRYLDEMKVMDIASQLGISRQSVHAHLRQAIEGIRKYYDKK